MAKTIILEVQSNFEIRRVPFGNFNILSPKFEFGLPLQKVQIVVDSSHSFAARPVFAEQLDEDICHEDGIALLGVFVKVQFIVEDQLTAVAGDTDAVIVAETFLHYALESVTDQLFIDLVAVDGLLQKLEVPQLARLIYSVGRLIETFGVVEGEALLG